MIGWRQKTNCCKISVPAPKLPPTCNYDICKSLGGLCDDPEAIFSKRDSKPYDNSYSSINYHFERDVEFSQGEGMDSIDLEKRATKWASGKNGLVRMRSNPYLSRGAFIASAIRFGWDLSVYTVTSSCIDIGIVVKNAVTTVVPEEVDTEHILDVRTILTNPSLPCKIFQDRKEYLADT